MDKLMFHLLSSKV